MSVVYRALAPAKINLGLFVGPRRPVDDRHELVSVMQSISLADELMLAPAAAGATTDELHCPGVSGPPERNLAARALAAFRAATGWDAPPLRLSIVKRIPVAAGLGGGSADAAAALRLAAFASGIEDRRLLDELAAGLGADVPAQVTPGRWLAEGAGERLHALPDPASPLGVLVLAPTAQLSTAAVYAEADRLDLIRTRAQLDDRRERLHVALRDGATLPGEELLHNDLQQAATALCAPLAEELASAREAGASHVFVSGSGPAMVALCASEARSATADDGSASPADRAGARTDRATAPVGGEVADDPASLRRVATALAARVPAPIAATSVGATFGQVVELSADGLPPAPA